MAAIGETRCQYDGRKHEEGEHPRAEIIEAEDVCGVIYFLFGADPRCEQDGVDAECQQKQERGGVAHAASSGIVGYDRPRMYEQFAAGVQEAPFEAEHVGKR